MWKLYNKGVNKDLWTNVFSLEKLYYTDTDHYAA